MWSRLLYDSGLAEEQYRLLHSLVAVRVPVQAGHAGGFDESLARRGVLGPCLAQIGGYTDAAAVDLFVARDCGYRAY